MHAGGRGDAKRHREGDNTDRQTDRRRDNTRRQRETPPRASSFIKKLASSKDISGERKEGGMRQMDSFVCFETETPAAAAPSLPAAP